MTTIDGLLRIFFVTTIGSAFSAISTFLTIEQTFSGLGAISNALSAKTVSSVATSFVAPALIERLGLKSSLLLSQIVGLIALAFLFLSYQHSSYELLLLGIMLTGVPAALTLIVLTSVFRSQSPTEELYRRSSARRELRHGVAMLMAALLSPWLLRWYGIEWVLAFDAVTFIAAGLMLLPMHDLNTCAAPVEQPPSLDGLIKDGLMKEKESRRFLISITCGLACIAVVPLAAASKGVFYVQGLSPVLRESLWSIDSLAAIGSGLLYRRFRRAINKPWISYLVSVNAVWLLLPALFPSAWALIVGLALSTLSMWLQMILSTDNYVLAAGIDSKTIQRHAAFASLIRNVLFSLSPMLLAWGFSNFSPLTFVGAFVLLQGVMTWVARRRVPHLV